MFGSGMKTGERLVNEAREDSRPTCPAHTIALLRSLVSNHPTTTNAKPTNAATTRHAMATSIRPTRLSAL